MSLIPAPPPLLGLLLLLTFALFAPSLCDSTLLKVQSPNPFEILSKKSPEKLLLPHPTDLDLDTFLSNDELPPPPPLTPFPGVSVTAALGLPSSSTITSIPFLVLIPVPTLFEEDEDDDDPVSVWFVLASFLSDLDRPFSLWLLLLMLVVVVPALG